MFLLYCNSLISLLQLSSVMSSTIKISIQRLRQIMAVHLSKFVLSFVATSAVFLLLSLFNPSKLLSLSVPPYSTIWLIIGCIVFFSIPALIYVTSSLSAKLRGVTETKIDPEAMKRTLFIAAGCLWSGIGTMILLSLIGGSFNLTKGVATIVVIVSWYGICRIALMYVRS